MYRFLTLTAAIFLLAACSGQVIGNPFSNATLPAPQVHITPPPDAQSAIQAFLEAWKTDDYASMYSLLTQDSQSSITLEDFDKAYRNAMNSLTLKELQYSIGSITKNPDSAQVAFKLTYKTNTLGDLQREMSANLKLESGKQWRIAWDDSLILPELRGGNHLSMAYDVPARGTIYDRNETPLVSQSEALALGLTPGEINPDQEGQVLATLSILTGLYPGTISNLYANAGPDWYIPVGEASLEDFNHYYGVMQGFNGVKWSQYNTRLYVNGIAPQAIGYASPIQKEEVDQYLRQGYSPGTRVGRIGIEKWAESYLAGKTGGTLYVAGSDGTILSQLGKNDPQPASSVHLTIDKKLQFQAQKAIEGFRGAIVVIERDSGRVLAMASSPGYDPNFFDPNNTNSGNGLTNLVNDPETPLVNRASQGKFPLGSVFKVITFSAALQSGTFTPETKLDCPYEFTEMTDKRRYDWTWEHFQDELLATGEGHTRPSGMLTLTGALMRSCNPWFWHIGKSLFDQGRVTAIADMARGFGLGKETGIGEIEEDAGTIPNPADEVEAVNEAIGQGDVLVTPLQVARMMAAIGNGGTLYRPQLVEKIVDPAGQATQLFKPEAQGVLPITSDTLNALRAAMREVVRNPRGTAYQRFHGTTENYDIYGKTGTAESGNGLSHAWFAGYTNIQNPNLADIAIAVIAENAGEGSQIAAPMFKRMVEVYFTGSPRSPYPWETSIGITRTPTSPVTPTIEEP
jgi:penicillin-binding protein 2